MGGGTEQSLQRCMPSSTSCCITAYTYNSVCTTSGLVDETFDPSERARDKPAPDRAISKRTVRSSAFGEIDLASAGVGSKAGGHTNNALDAPRDIDVPGSIDGLRGRCSEARRKTLPDCPKRAGRDPRRRDGNEIGSSSSSSSQSPTSGIGLPALPSLGPASTQGPRTLPDLDLVGGGLQCLEHFVGSITGSATWTWPLFGIIGTGAMRGEEGRRPR